ncbi:Protein of unknown function DUF935 [uncultured Caudovirales phage]|uniref:DUF935 family protein n=1 Tax=uncultured Caudovirales phage TaxID=2100421 RepID=A0A6J5RDX2_9CAUD|nr:Protein of unknown function DUF935 [uncultured Caudovirales phage]
MKIFGIEIGGKTDKPLNIMTRPVQTDLSRNIIPFQIYRTRQDIKKWRDAITSAENPLTPQRQLLYTLYRDLDLDSQVTTAWNKRKDCIKLREFDIYDKDGNENEAASAIFESEWFLRFMDYALDSILWGHSLVELGDVINGMFCELELVPRINVVPERGIVVAAPGLMEGVSYLEEPYNIWNISIGQPRDLGLFMKLAPYVLWKKNAMGAFAEFAELFGVPVRIGRTDIRELTARQNMEKMLANMGTSAWGVFDLEDKIELIESTSKGGSDSVHAVLIKICNDEIAKLILGHNASVDATAGKLGSEGNAMDSIAEKSASDARFVEMIVNDKLIPAMLAIGFPGLNEGDYFDFSNDDEEDHEEAEHAKRLQEIAVMVKTFSEGGLNVDPAQIMEMTGLKLTAKPTMNPLTTQMKSKALAETINKMYYGGHDGHGH